MAIRDRLFLSIIMYMLPSIIYTILSVIPPKNPQLAPWADFRTALSNRARYFSAAEATRADMHMPGRAVNDCGDAFNVRFPHPVAAPVGVADFYPERNSFSAIITFSHTVNLLPVYRLRTTGICC